ncbi:MAG: nucleotide exchange factor GrpE [Candidatus Brevundimonas phytovorans]|nr:nucleotide exchange factor GrpE [Brevundimonas sp.]WEK57876.1 MAG: nucleotide exchange factor GrpE [Brevundimonas sp.]
MNDINDDTRDQLEQDMGEAAIDAAQEAAEDGDMAVVDALIAERDQWKDRALRAVADAENTKRRAETQANDARAYAIQRFAKDLLGVADTLERGLLSAPKVLETVEADSAAASMVTGLELTQKSLLSAFESNGLTRVAPEPGEAFDPHLHQAVMEQPSDTVPGGTVIQTLQPGYALFGRTVRAAMVVVAAKGSGPASGGAYSEANTTGGNFDAKA